MLYAASTPTCNSLTEFLYEEGFSTVTTDAHIYGEEWNKCTKEGMLCDDLPFAPAALFTHLLAKLVSE